MINLKNNRGLIKQCPTGFSWTMLFFGGLVPLFRGDLKWFAITVICDICTSGLAWFVFPFIYNKIYIKGLLSQEFQPADDFSQVTLRQMGVY